VTVEESWGDNRAGIKADGDGEEEGCGISRIGISKGESCWRLKAISGGDRLPECCPRDVLVGVYIAGIGAEEGNMNWADAKGKENIACPEG